MRVRGRRVPTGLDLGAVASVALSTIAMAGLPPASAALGVETPTVAIVITLAVLGALGIVACWTLGAVRSARPIAAIALLVVGVGLWIVLVVVAAPALGWRVAGATVGLLSALAVAASWFLLRGYATRASPALGILVLGAPVVLFADSLPVLLAVLVGAPVATFLVGFLLARRDPSAAQDSAAR